METEKIETRERNGKINYWNRINITSVFCCTPITDIVRRDIMYTRRRVQDVGGPDAHLHMYVSVKFSVLGQTARVVQFICIIPAVMQIVATLWFKLTETDSFR